MNFIKDKDYKTSSLGGSKFIIMIKTNMEKKSLVHQKNTVKFHLILTIFNNFYFFVIYKLYTYYFYRIYIFLVYPVLNYNNYI